MMKVAKDKSPSLRQWVVGIVLTVCLTVPATVFAAVATTEGEIIHVGLPITGPGALTGSVCSRDTSTQSGCEKCVREKCNAAYPTLLQTFSRLTCINVGYQYCQAKVDDDLTTTDLPFAEIL